MNFTDFIITINPDELIQRSIAMVCYWNNFPLYGSKGNGQKPAAIAKGG